MAAPVLVPSTTTTTRPPPTTTTTRAPLPTTTTTVPHRALLNSSRSAPLVAAPVAVPAGTSCGSSAYWQNKQVSQLRYQAHACWDGLIDSRSWPASTAFDVMFCESKGNPWAHNPSGANGLFQDMGGPYGPSANVEVAYEKWKGAGHTFWGPWSSSSSCWA